MKPYAIQPNTGLSARFAILLSVLISLSFFTGCIRDGLDECPQDVVLKFRYAVSPDKPTGIQPPEVDCVSVFIFDKDGYYLDRIDCKSISLSNGYELGLQLGEGTYQFVAWAGLMENLCSVVSFIPDETKIENAWLQLNREEDNTINCQSHLLYHGIHEAIHIEKRSITVVPVDLYRTTNDIRVIVNGLNPDRRYSMYIEDNNGKCDFYHTIAADNKLTYYPDYGASGNEEGQLVGDFTVMRLLPGREPRLRIVDDVSRDVRYDENLMGALLEKYPDVDFVYDHDFTVEITFGDGYMPVSIKINGWELKEEEGDL